MDRILDLTLNDSDSMRDIPVKLSCYKAGVEATLERRLDEISARLLQRQREQIAKSEEDMRQWFHATVGPQFGSFSSRLSADTHASRMMVDQNEVRIKRLEDRLDGGVNDIIGLQTRLVQVDARLTSLDTRADEASKRADKLDGDLQDAFAALQKSVQAVNDSHAEKEAALARRIDESNDSLKVAVKQIRCSMVEQAFLDVQALQSCEDKLLAVIAASAQKSVEQAKASLDECDSRLQEKISTVEHTAKDHANECLEHATQGTNAAAKEVREELHSRADRVAAKAHANLEEHSARHFRDLATNSDAARAHTQGVGEKAAEELKTEAARMREDMTHIRLAIKSESDVRVLALSDIKGWVSREVNDATRRTHEALISSVDAAVENAQRELAGAQEASEKRDGVIELALSEATKQAAESTKRGVEATKQHCAVMSNEVAKQAMDQLRLELTRGLEDGRNRTEAFIIAEVERLFRKQLGDKSIGLYIASPDQGRGSGPGQSSVAGARPHTLPALPKSST